MIRRLVLAGCGVAMLSSVAAADQPKVKVKDDSDRVVCKSEAITGSRMRRSVCATKGEWEDLTRKAQDQMTNRLEQGNGNEPDPLGTPH